MGTLWSLARLEEIGLKLRHPVTITYVSGIEVKGMLSTASFSGGNKLQILKLNDATISQCGKELENQKTDLLDLVIGENITNVVARPVN